MSLTHVSRADLVGELLDKPRPGSRRELACREAGHLVPLDAVDESLLARKLALARELLMRELRAAMHDGPLFAAPGEVRDWLRLRFAGLDHEVFVVLHLDAQHRLIDAVEMFRGTLTQTSVYPREIVKAALSANAAAVAFAHNHPSGASIPSRADEHLTHTLKAALALVDVRVIDHFVVAGTDVTSFAECGRL